MILNLKTTRLKIVLGGVLVALMLLAPLLLSDFRLSLLGKFLAYAILAVGLDLIWGFTGILSLGHGVYFGLGAYCIAMHLKLEASHGQLPDFMAWSGVDRLPWFWAPFTPSSLHPARRGRSRFARDGAGLFHFFAAGSKALFSRSCPKRSLSLWLHCSSDSRATPEERTG